MGLPLLSLVCHPLLFLVMVARLLGGDKVVVDDIEGESSQTPSETGEEVPVYRKASIRMSSACFSSVRDDRLSYQGCDLPKHGLVLEDGGLSPCLPLGPGISVKLSHLEELLKSAVSFAQRRTTADRPC